MKAVEGLDACTQLLCVRHGETFWNREARMQGHLDIGLNEQGRQQAQRLAQRLASDHLDAIYSSDLSRARDTAQAVADAHGQALRLEPRLRERHFGAFQGLTWSELEQQDAAAALRWRKRDPVFDLHGGESLQDFDARVREVVHDIAQAHRGQTVILLTHGGVLDCLYRAATRLSLDAPRSWLLGNASINRLLYGPQGLVLVGWNDDHHLQALSLDEHDYGQAASK